MRWWIISDRLGKLRFATCAGALEILDLMHRMNPHDRFTFTSIYEKAS
jgi:hypothetical protein